MNLAEQVQHAIPPAIKPVLDVLTVTTAFGAIVGALTTVFGLIAAVASAAWAMIRLYETKTVQRWVEKRRK